LSFSAELQRIVELGLELRDLSQYENFEAVLIGFGNLPQFFDTLFEVCAASLFSRLETTERLRFAPLYKVRDRQKRPDFDVHSRLGVLSVECKRPHSLVQRAAETFRVIARALHQAMKAVDWPRELRLGVEIMAPLREAPSSLAERLVNLALAGPREDGAEIRHGTVRAFVQLRKSPFCLTDVRFGHDVMILDRDEATGLFNPDFTMLRVVNNGLGHQVAQSVGRRLAEALSQLPSENGGVIVLGDVPRRVADGAIARRIDEPAYGRILAFVVHEADDFHFTYRTYRPDAIQELLGSGPRPLVPAA